MIDYDKIKQVEQFLKDTIPEDVLLMMVDRAHRMGVLDAIVTTKTTDPDVLAQWLYEEKERVVPLEGMKGVVEKYIPILEKEGLLLDGEPTPEALEISLHHMLLMSEGRTVQ